MYYLLLPMMFALSLVGYNGIYNQQNAPANQQIALNRSTNFVDTQATRFMALRSACLAWVEKNKNSITASQQISQDAIASLTPVGFGASMAQRYTASGTCVVQVSGNTKILYVNSDGDLKTVGHILDSYGQDQTVGYYWVNNADYSTYVSSPLFPGGKRQIWVDYPFPQNSLTPGLLSISIIGTP